MRENVGGTGGVVTSHPLPCGPVSGWQRPPGLRLIGRDPPPVPLPPASGGGEELTQNGRLCTSAQTKCSLRSLNSDVAHVLLLIRYTLPHEQRFQRNWFVSGSTLDNSSEIAVKFLVFIRPESKADSSFSRFRGRLSNKLPNFLSQRREAPHPLDRHVWRTTDSDRNGSSGESAQRRIVPSVVGGFSSRLQPTRGQSAGSRGRNLRRNRRQPAESAADHVAIRTHLTQVNHRPKWPSPVCSFLHDRCVRLFSI